MSDALVVLATAPNRQQAETIAAALVEEKLAACVNVLGEVSSIYRWQGAVQRDEEALMIIKTSRQRFAALRRRFVELHSYDVPELLALPVADGAPDYLAWLFESLR